MPFYRYQALDQKGQSLEGTVEAQTPQEAAQKLQQRGFRVQSLVDPNPAAPVINDISHPNRPANPYEQWRGSDKQRFFILAQMSDLLKAGVNPANGLMTLSQQMRNIGFADSLKRMAQSSAEGKRISDVMALYPGLWPDHVVGMVRAGEVGGFLPDALMLASDQARNTHKFRLFHWWVWAAIVNILLSIPLPFVAFAGFEGAFWKAWNGNSNVTPTWVFQQYWVCIVNALKWPIGPVVGVFYLICAGIWWYFAQDSSKRKRHLIGYSFSFLGKRTRLEGAALFAWTLSRLSRAGHSPRTCWTMASDTIPNMVMREQMVQVGTQMHEGSSLSDALSRTTIFPEEYSSMAVTGEMTGSIPATFERLANSSNTEFDAQTSYAKARTGCWGCLSLVLATAISFGLLLYLYGEMLRKIMETI